MTAVTDNHQNATDTSNRITSSNKAKQRSVHGKRHVQVCIKPFLDVIHNDVTVACKTTGFRPWRCVVPLLRYLKRKRFNVNAVLNRALLFYLKAEVDDDWLRDEARLALLLKEEQWLIRLNKVMLRSGAYLDLYADKVLRGSKARLDAKLGRKPLAALAPDEEPIFKRLIARREAVVKEIKEILGRRLPKDEYVLKDERLPSRRRGKNKLGKEVR